jgi:hypothetical protein
MRGRTVLAVGLVGIPTMVMGTMSGVANAVGADTTAPSVPTGVHQVGSDRPWYESSLAWTGSTDNSGAVSFYWVKNVSAGNRIKPRTTTTSVGAMLSPYCAVPTGTVITVTVQAVDAAGNTSAPSAPITVKIN